MSRVGARYRMFLKKICQCIWERTVLLLSCTNSGEFVFQTSRKSGGALGTIPWHFGVNPLKSWRKQVGKLEKVKGKREKVKG